MKKLLFLRLFAFVVSFTALNVFAKILMYTLVTKTIGFPPDTGKYVSDLAWLRNVNMYLGYCYLLYLALTEEVIFRFLPLVLCISFEKSRKFWPLVAIVSSILFALVHGSWGNIFLQGVGGLLYSVVFGLISIKDAKIESFIKALITTTVLHAMYNLVITYYW